MMMITLQSAHLGCGIEAWDEAGHPVTGHHHLHSSHHRHRIDLQHPGGQLLVILCPIFVILGERQRVRRSKERRW